MRPVDAGGRTAMTAASAVRRVRPSAQAAALALGGLVLVLAAVDVPLARLGHQSLNSSGGASPVWFSVVSGIVGFVVASRKPGNPLGWILLALATVTELSQDASFYVVADYRLRHGSLPLGWVAVLAQPGWAVAAVLGGLAILLFPDGRPPSPRWRWVVWLFLAAAALWVGGAFIASVGAIASHDIRVDASGNLMVLTHTTGSSAWWGVIEAVFLPVLILCWVGSVLSQAVSYRRSSGERRQQLKWLLAGSVTYAAAAPLAVTLSEQHGILGVASTVAGGIAQLGIPVCMGVAVMKYRLFEIDRIISRTLAYAIVTGLLIGVYAGIVLLATRVATIKAPIAVAGSTLAAAALFHPLRRRVQHAVDRRFNRARYDADRVVAAFAAGLKDAADVDSVRDDLVGAVQQALEPAHLSVWMGNGLSGTARPDVTP